MIFNVKSVLYSEAGNWNKCIDIRLIGDGASYLTLSSKLNEPVVHIGLSDSQRTLTCLKNDFSYFRLPEQFVLKIASSLKNNGMNAEPIVLDISADLDTEMLIKAFKVLTLH